MKNLYIGMEVLVAGKPVTEFTHEGNTWIEGRKGSEYVLKLTNEYARRVYIVPSIDGLSIIDGKPATPNSPGYILEAKTYNSRPTELIIPGWLVDNSTVAKFQFHDRNKSYGNNSSQNDTNTGVIGAMVYFEKVASNYTSLPITWPSGILGWPYLNSIQSFGAISTPVQLQNNSGETSINTNTSIGTALYTVTTPDGYTTQKGFQSGLTQEQAQAMCDQIYAAYNNSPSFEVGTKFGDSKNWNTNTIEFEREDNAFTTLVIYYDTLKNLERRGINVYASRRKPLPSPFNNTFCQTPQGWKK